MIPGGDEVVQLRQLPDEGPESRSVNPEGLQAHTRL